VSHAGQLSIGPPRRSKTYRHRLARLLVRRVLGRPTQASIKPRRALVIVACARVTHREYHNPKSAICISTNIAPSCPQLVQTFAVRASGCATHARHTSSYLPRRSTALAFSYLLAAHRSRPQVSNKAPSITTVPGRRTGLILHPCAPKSVSRQVQQARLFLQTTIGSTVFAPKRTPFRSS
jgi:hypothetical protein